MKGDQFYTTCFLKFHECVEAMERVKILGKQGLKKLINLTREREILSQRLKTNDFKQHENVKKEHITFLYSQAISNIQFVVMEEIANFEDYLQKAKHNAGTLTQISLKGGDIGEVLERNGEIYAALCQLMKIISQSFEEQVQLVEKVWKAQIPHFFSSFNTKKLEILLLHISFQTHVSDKRLTQWTDYLRKLHRNDHQR